METAFRRVAVAAIVLVGGAVAALSSCTDNSLARNWGGTEKVALKPNEIVLNVTWKNDEMWICTKDTTNGVVYFREKSSWGMMEGTVILK